MHWPRLMTSTSRAGSDGVQSEVDEDALGLQLLAAGVDPQVNIIAVHGLDGHRDQSWTADSNKKMWLKDFLPLDIPNARIFTYGYNASTHGNPGIEFLDQHAEGFVDHLCLNLPDTPRLPIIFIAHSLGGLLVKSALIHSDNARIGHLEQHKSIKLSTCGIVFMGTPHQGADTTLGKLVLNIASVVIRTNRKLVGNLEKDGEWLQSQARSYLSISDDFDTIYCYETIPTPPSRSLVVPYASTVVQGGRNAPAVGINQDHIQMVKFPSRTTRGYRDVSLHVKRMVGNAAGRVEANWAEWDALKESRRQRMNPHPHDNQIVMKTTSEPVETPQEQSQATTPTPFSLSLLQGAWVGELIYPSGPPGVALSVSFEPFEIGRTTNGRGLDSNGEFNTESAQFTYLSTNDYVGTVRKTANQIFGEWYDSPQSGRQRTGTFNLKHSGSQSVQSATPKDLSPIRSPPPPSLEGEWSGELIYSSGPPGVALKVSFEPFLIGRTTSGHGVDNNCGEFNIQSAQFTNLLTDAYIGVVTFLQTYKSQFSGQVWSFMGTVHKDTNRIFGEWHDSPQDGRRRTGKFILQRGSQSVQLATPLTLPSTPPSLLSPLEGAWSGELVYSPGLPGVTLTVWFEPFIIGRTTNGRGIDNNGEFSVQSAQFTYLSTDDYVGVITFSQIYSKWPSRLWYFVGAVRKDNNEIFGEWHDSPQDGRQRTGTFKLKRGSQSTGVQLSAPTALSPIFSSPLPSLDGEWSGELIYPSGPPGIALAVSFEPFVIGKTTNGHGTDNNGEFNVQSAQFTYSLTDDYVGVVTFLQTYKTRWSGQVWCFIGAVHKDTNRISGEWYDSPQSGRQRIGKFILERGR